MAASYALARVAGCHLDLAQKAVGLLVVARQQVKCRRLVARHRLLEGLGTVPHGLTTPVLAGAVALLMVLIQQKGLFWLRAVVLRVQRLVEPPRGSVVVPEHGGMSAAHLLHRPVFSALIPICWIWLPSHFPHRWILRYHDWPVVTCILRARLKIQILLRTIFGFRHLLARSVEDVSQRLAEGQRVPRIVDVLNISVAAPPLAQGQRLNVLTALIAFHFLDFVMISIYYFE